MGTQNSYEKIKIGYKVGQLTVTNDTGERKNGYVVWECTCECGNSICLESRSIKRGTITDCGCKNRNSRKLDLTGLRYGKLLCLSPTDMRDNNRSVMWECQCDCGNTCMVSARDLRYGYVKSCGCLHHSVVMKDFIGKRFGELTVMEYADKKDGMHYWKCVCDCGEETIVGQTLLQSGKTKSCGCRRAAVMQDNLKLFDGTAITLLKKRKMSNNTSGYTGVSQNKKTGLWMAKITFRKHTYYLGSYKDIEDAIKARLKGEEMHDDFLEWYYKEYPEGKQENVPAE